MVDLLNQSVSLVDSMCVELSEMDRAALAAVAWFLDLSLEALHTTVPNSAEPIPVAAKFDTVESGGGGSDADLEGGVLLERQPLGALLLSPPSSCCGLVSLGSLLCGAGKRLSVDALAALRGRQTPTRPWVYALNHDMPQQANGHDCGAYTVAAMMSFVEHGHALLPNSRDLGAQLRARQLAEVVPGRAYSCVCFPRKCVSKVCSGVPDGNSTRAQMVEGNFALWDAAREHAVTLLRSPMLGALRAVVEGAQADQNALLVSCGLLRSNLRSSLTLLYRLRS